LTTTSIFYYPTSFLPPTSTIKTDAKTRTTQIAWPFPYYTEAPTITVNDPANATLRATYGILNCVNIALTQDMSHGSLGIVKRCPEAPGQMALTLVEEPVASDNPANNSTRIRDIGFEFRFAMDPDTTLKQRSYSATCQHLPAPDAGAGTYGRGHWMCRATAFDRFFGLPQMPDADMLLATLVVVESAASRDSAVAVVYAVGSVALLSLMLWEGYL
jgi:hypothetical protein